MFDTIPTQSSDPALANPAVARCCAAGAAARRAAIAQKQSRYDCTVATREAYRNKVMPPLCGVDSIRDFVACVAHGSLLGVFSDSESTKLLYAAQVLAGGMSQSRTSKAS